ncbi:MAG: hypothetical protein QOE90_1937 [Thermoplasmata archaeon]|jgi:hypothetical protein|nr:hypothetical protein [Thermoplasmata archaeon]
MAKPNAKTTTTTKADKARRIPIEKAKKHPKSASRTSKRGDVLLMKRADQSDIMVRVVDLAAHPRKPTKKAGAKKSAHHGGVVAHDHHRPATRRDATKGGADTAYHNAGDAPGSTSVSDNGGPKITNANIHLLFWGSQWLQMTTSPSASAVLRAIDSILAGPYMNTLNQYGVGRATIADAFIITSPNPPASFSESNVQDMVWSLIDAGDFPEPDDAGGNNELFAFIMPPGTSSSTAGRGGFHSTASDYDFPFDWDTAWYLWVMNGSLDTITSLFSHELVEACTDPEGDAVQVNPRNGSSWNEIADVCSSTDVLNGVRVQSYWSDRDKACVIPIPSRNPIDPASRRRITLNARFHVTDPGLFSDDVGDFSGSRSVVLDANNPTQQIVLRSGAVGGESSADLVVDLTWNADYSVGVRFRSALYDESDVDSSTSNSFTLGRDTWQSWWINHVSGDWVEADSCHIDFDVTNVQA